MKITIVMLSFLFSASLHAAEYTLTLATLAPPDSPWSAVLSKYEKAVEAKSQGRIDVKLKIGGVLGDEIETVTKCVRGHIQAVGATTGALASQVPELNLVELPYLFRNYEEADHVVDHVLTPEFDSLLKKQGLVLGFWSENGYRQIGLKDKAVHSPADLKGKKMRAQESAVHMQMYKAFGASAVPIPATEVTQALATGNVDGFDQSALYAIAASWYKGVQHISITDHMYQPALIVFNQKWFQSLPKDLQAVVVEEGRLLQDKGRKAVRHIFPDLVNIFKAEKIDVYTLTEQEKRVFEQASQPVWKTFRTTGGAKASALMDKVLAALKKFRSQA
jgi:TRAP-type C4-dicarboxylate transport system substrate-binding protein